jgi:hypothetical protein
MSTEDLKILCVTKSPVYALLFGFADWSNRARFKSESMADLEIGEMNNLLSAHLGWISLSLTIRSVC